MTGPVAERGDELRRRGGADEHLLPPATAPKRQGGTLREQLALGRRGGSGRRELRRRPAQRADRRRALTRAAREVAARRLGAGAAGPRGQRLLQPPQRVAQLELAEDVPQARAIGLARASPARRRRPARRADRRQLLGDARVVGVVGRFSLRLAPEISSTCASTASREPNCCRSWAAVLSPMPGTPGMLSECRPSGRRSRGSARAGCRSAR